MKLFQILLFIKEDTLKKCSKCETAKLITKFYFRRNSQKCSIECKQCVKVKQREKRNSFYDDFIFLNNALSIPKAMIEILTKSYVDSISENIRNSHDLLTVIIIQDKELDNNRVTIIDRNPTIDNDLSTKNYVDDSMGKGSIFRYNQSIQKRFKVQIGNTEYNLTIPDRFYRTHTTRGKNPNRGGWLLQQWNIKCIDTINRGKKIFLWNFQQQLIQRGAREQRAKLL